MRYGAADQPSSGSLDSGKDRGIQIEIGIKIVVEIAMRIDKGTDIDIGIAIEIEKDKGRYFTS